MTPVMTKFDPKTGLATFDDQSTVQFPADAKIETGHDEFQRESWRATSAKNETVVVSLFLGATKTHIEAAVRRCALGV